MKVISLLGATGSIGKQTLEIVRENRDKFQLAAFSAGQNIDLVRKIIVEFSPKLVSVQHKEDCDRLKTEFPHVSFTYGEEGLIEVAVFHESSILVNAVIGSIGFTSTIRAIEEGKTIALANKESLVTAGHIVMKKAEQYNVPIIPVDSEHSAIFQCLQGEQEKNIERLIITASGGSFRDKKRNELENVTVEDALNHPNWSMGKKITIDSATMMNKGLEVIEAHWLFHMPYEKIDVILHRESTIHSMIEFHDSSIIAQLGTPDMRVPIQYALTYPDRIPLKNANRLNLAALKTLHFEEMDFERFRCLKFAYEAGKKGGTMPTVLNAANEIAVDAFLNGKIKFLEIEELIEQALEYIEMIPHPSIEEIIEIDKQTRHFVQSRLHQK